ncbi:MAG: response regulator [Lachnospiraceae bacterium]|nr:response regulator [Lachnospiraceae bacterium]
MNIVLAGILICLAVIGVLFYKLAYKGRVKAVNDALSFVCGVGVATMLCCAVLTVSADKNMVMGMYTFYYIFYAMTLFAFARFAYVFCTGSDRDLFRSPLFYGTVMVVLMMLNNLFTHDCFTVTVYDFYGYMFPKTVHQGIFFLYASFMVMESLIAALYLISAYIRSAHTYRPRYIMILMVIIFHLGMEYLSSYLGLPTAIKTCFLLPEGLLLAYLCSYYSTRRLTMAVLNFVTDNNTTGLMIYDEDDYLIYHNKKIDEILTGEQLREFYEIENMNRWSSDLEEVNEIYIKRVVIDGETKYYNIFKREFTEGDSYIGTSFSFHDTTEALERFAMVEEANEELKRAAHMKSDFLANMSHEIRTPMNAVIGLAEMALREDMTDQARDYLGQIKSSGRNLLNIINDILDFSKIESGKMDIIPEPYEPLSEFNDVANTLITRIGDKDIELTMEENPSIPSKLEGDVLRIRQILINLANNAIKFTNRGRVQIISDFTPIDNENIMLRFHVVDTGQGIKKEDLKKLFNSFQQVDSKRNRSIEGTGLGLAISKSLVETMGGSIGVESEYGKGSDFFFEIPQKIVDATPSISVNQPENIFALGRLNKKYLARRFFIDCSKMGVFNVVLRYCEDYESTCDLYADTIEGKRKYIFFEECDYRDGVRDLLINDPELIGVMLAEFGSTVKPDLKNVRIIKKPFSTVAIAMALNNMELHLNNEDGKAYVSDFTAPDARILIVDDNMVNLTVAEGLLEPLKMKVVCAASGKEAIEKINIERFDIVFMDHMMPEMDGVETTHIIRRMYPELAEMPIIALTANAVSGVKEFFLKEGMNDFVPKPIEIRDIMTKVRQWLPEDKIKKGYKIVDVDSDEDDEIDIPGLDVHSAMAMIGSPKLYIKILKEYYRNIETNHKQLEEAYESQNWEDYTIKVHALKSSSRQIGAKDLAGKAEALENAGKAGDIDYIRNNSQEALDEYIALEALLHDHCADEDDAGAKPQIETDTLKTILDKTIAACDELDMDAMESIVEELRRYSYSDEIQADIDSMIESAELMDVFTCKEIAEKLLDM